MIRTIEEQALNAWPARQQLFYDGWVLRFANGYTKRANSVNPLYPGDGRPVAQKIEHCLKLYEAAQMPAVFRLTPLAEPEDLDAQLAARGFVKQSLTSVQIIALEGLSTIASPNFHFWPTFSSAWAAEFERLHGPTANSAAHRAILQAILPSRCFATLTVAEVVACGLAVLENDRVGLFDIVTAASQRRRGFGQALILNMLHWAKTQGATTAYLQVETGNQPALALYKKIGFRELYRYWYRVQEA
ncbi:MAG: GNAT family N-acetyltransferase [Anaerolineae bacterium]|nr:GNAT family N-acetyltransferase [Anaerolineae bacterium]